MTTDSTRPGSNSTEGEHFLFDDWFDPLENGVRTRIRSFIEDLLEAELNAALGRARYERAGAGEGGPPRSAAGSRHGHRDRRILGTFGATTVRVPRARLVNPEGKTSEWRNAIIPAWLRRTKRADALIAGAYLSGTNTRRVRRALAALFGGAVGEGHGQPGMAQDQRRLGRLERSSAWPRTHCAAYPRRHGREGAAR
jgi:hypothetical protein